MSEIVNLDEVRERLKVAQAAVGGTPPLTDSERLNITVESMKLAYQAILEIFERLETLERTRGQGRAVQAPVMTRSSREHNSLA